MNYSVSTVQIRGKTSAFGGCGSLELTVSESLSGYAEFSLKYSVKLNLVHEKSTCGFAK